MSILSETDFGITVRYYAQSGHLTIGEPSAVAGISGGWPSVSGHGSFTGSNYYSFLKISNLETNPASLFTAQSYVSISKWQEDNGTWTVIFRVKSNKVQDISPYDSNTLLLAMGSNNAIGNAQKISNTINALTNTTNISWGVYNTNLQAKTFYYSSYDDGYYFQVINDTYANSGDTLDNTPPTESTTLETPTSFEQQSGGAVGDPHIKPINGKSFDLPNEEETFLLFTNNDNDYPVTIKGMCWKIPPYVYMPKINKLKKVGFVTRAKNYFDVLVDSVFFKYIECVCNDEKVIFDMENLAPCKYTSSEDLYNYSLPVHRNANVNFFIKFSEIYHATKGIRNNVPSKTTMERKVTMVGQHFVLTLKLRRDARDIITRNSLELSSTNVISGHTGALVHSKCIIFTKFSE